MPTYLYTTHATESAQEVVADNLPAAVRSLLEKHVEVARVGEPPAERAGDGVIPEAELCIFLRQLAAMLENGTPMVESLRLLAKESRHPGVRRAVSSTAEEVAEGIALSAAMGRRPRAFGPLVAAMVRAGEHSGALPATLREIAEQREGFARITRHTLTMLVYPAAVGTWAFTVVIFLLSFIVPKFIELFKELGVKELPAPTRFVMLLSHGLAWFMLALLASGGVALGLYLARRRTTRGRLILDYWRLGTPIAGRVNLNLALGRVSSALGLLLARGVPIVESLRLAGAAAGNAVIAAAFRRAERAVSEGRPVADGLREAQVLPESFVWRVAVGESSGDLAGALSRMGAFYVDASYITARAVQGVIEPAVVIAMGLLVLLIVLGIFTPLVSILQSLSGS